MTSSTAPLVSVYLPTRDRASCLAQAIESVLEQSERRFELIIVDDGSCDETPTICARYASRDHRVRYLRHESSLGAPVARNRALAEARGQFITGLDDDDLMLPRRLESLISHWAPGLSFVCSSYYLERYPGARRTVLHRRARQITVKDLLHQNFVGNQLFTRTENLRAIGGFDESFVASQDYDSWTRLSAQFGAGQRIAEPSYVIRQRVTGASISASDRFGIGARQYTAKHAEKMSASQLRSQRLLHRITARERVRLYEWPKLFAWPTAGLLLRYTLSQWRWLRSLRDLMLR